MLRLFRFLKNVHFNEIGFNSVLIPSCEWGYPRIFFFFLHKKDVFRADFEVNNTRFYH